MSEDTMLLSMLTAFNEAGEVDDPIPQSLEVIRGALGARMVEVWLSGEDSAHAVVCYSSSNGLPVGTAPDTATQAVSGNDMASLVDGVITTGRLATAALSLPDAAGVCTAAAFPIHSSGGIVGSLVLLYATAFGPTEDAQATASMACHHIGHFLERLRTEGRARAHARELSELASTDSLTGLKNRREFDRALRTIPRQPFALLSVDVDHLKETNDAHGHPAGDAVLRAVGNTLGLIVRGWDVMARVGGDEFAALLPGVGVFGAALVSERMREAVHALDLASGPVRITLGWSAAPAGADPVSVWHKADECLYAAKQAGRDTVIGCSYERGEAGDIIDRSYSDVVTQVLAGGAVHAVFQPIVDLIDGSVVGYEALARPDGFAPMDSVEAVFEAARTGGQIRDLDWLCRRRAIADARALPQAGVLFLNMSAAALLDPVHGVDQLLLALREAERSPRSVVIEITEHERIRDYNALSAVLSTYRAEGLRFALDDVGEGHSTLELLIASGSEYLKLGRSLTMTSSRIGSRAAIEATLAFAGASGAVVIAEGVENEFVCDLMKAANIRLGQGFGLGKPTLAADVEDVTAALIGRVALRALRPRQRSAHRGDAGVFRAPLT